MSTSLLNKKATKDYTLVASEEIRNGRFTRVSQEFIDRIDARVKNIIWEEVRRHPSVGKTLK